MSDKWKIEEPVRAFAGKYLDLARKTLRELTLIPAATGEEKTRAAYCLSWMEREKMEGAHLDGTGNVIWEYLPEKSQKVLYTAHLDTVFSMEEPLEVKEDGDIWRCPGIGDDTANVVLLLLAAKYVNETKPDLPQGLIFSCDLGEEGLGNLKGIRALVDAYEEELSAVVSFDLYREKMYPECIGSSRFRITVKTEGGHSFLNFGNANAIAELSSLITELYQFQPDPDSHTTYNVGVIEGGTSVNTIAEEASMLFEFRSDSYKSLEDCETYLQETLEKRQNKNVQITCEVVGKRPCGRETDPVVMARLEKCCAKTLKEADGVLPAKAEASTDCNIPLSHHIPAVCVGFLCGGGAHTREEWLDVSTLEDGLAAAAALVCRIPYTSSGSEIAFRDQITSEEEREQIHTLLKLCDQDFVPPLSHRESTSQTDWSKTTGKTDGILEYLDNVCAQHVVLWKDHGVIQSFMTWKDHFNCENLAEYPDSCYLTTLCVNPDYRGEGISEVMYQLAEEDIGRKFPGSEITLRTWSTNNAQDHILPKLGYRLIRRLTDDRGPGIDTVYFVKNR